MFYIIATCIRPYIPEQQGACFVPQKQEWAQAPCNSRGLGRGPYSAELGRARVAVLPPAVGRLLDQQLSTHTDAEPKKIKT